LLSLAIVNRKIRRLTHDAIEVSQSIKEKPKWINYFKHSDDLSNLDSAMHSKQDSISTPLSIPQTTK
jgi:hypothetical protein